jgi:hypothetical protein
MVAQSWAIALTLAGFISTAFGLWLAHATARSDYLRALRMEARMRYLNKQVTRQWNSPKAIAAAPEASAIYHEWARRRADRQRRFWKIPPATYDDLDVAPYLMTRKVQGLEYHSIASDLVWVGAGLLLSLLGSIVPAVWR